MNKNDIATRIYDAFLELPIPKKIVKGYSFEELEIEKAFRNLHWKEIGTNFIFPTHAESLCFMTAEAYKFYMPAYMISTIISYDQTDIAVDNLLSSLKLPLKNDNYYGISYIEAMNVFKSRVNKFNLLQKEAIKLFLEFVCEHYEKGVLDSDSKIALDRYWLNYCQRQR
jgi:hypothetical protein